MPKKKGFSLIPRRKGNDHLVAPPNFKLPAWAEHKPAAHVQVPESHPNSDPEMESDPEDLVF